MSATGTVRLALVGCGAIADWHRLAIGNVARIAVTACVDVDRSRAERAAGEYGAQVYEDLGDALADPDVDAVLLMLPHRLHEVAAIRALESGKHVMLEKPMAPTPGECTAILKAAESASGVFMLAENAQYWPEVLIASQVIASGRIGEVVTASATLFFPPLPDFYGGDKAWRLSREATGGGISVDTGSHYIRPLRMWLGEIDEVVAVMERPYEAMEGESLARALLRFRSGKTGTLDLMITDAPVAPRDMFRITGTKGEIGIGAHVTVYDEDHRGGVAADPERPQGYLLSYEGQIADFASAILDGTDLAAPPELALGELYTALAMERSAESERWEKVWEAGP